MAAAGATRDKLLVVEDDPDIARALTAYAAKRGFEVLYAADGKQALEIGTTAGPDVILLDIALPEVDGRDVFVRLRDAGALEKAVVIFATARDSQIDRLHGLELGAADYETKPFHLETLFRKIETLLKKKRGGEI
jgi:DNA-binding response OmpR family regulator